ncbi:pentatricopeptide repeat-containing protein At1g33350 [Typha angustifolia]|uniref:pentatricopeptide repeat-containing protein At1g33350 n=1 Tax=Typha angustifolia TaxID=59011 RepID=UPI003C2CF228
MLPNPIPHTNSKDQALSLLGRCTHLAHLKQLQSRLITSGHGQSQFVSFKLVRFCSLVLADLRYARSIFDSLAAPNVFLYTAMLTAYSSICDAGSVVDLFNRMLRRGHPRPNEFIYPLVLRALFPSHDAGLNLMKLVHTHVVKSGFEGYNVVQTSLLDVYARFADLHTARLLFDGLSERNVVSRTAMISGYARVGKMANAMSLFEEMHERDVPSWNAVVAGCAQNGLFSDVVSLFQRMVVEGARPNQTTVSCVLSACGHLGMLRLGKLVHGYIYRNRIGFNSFVLNGLIDMYGKCGNLKEARWIFNVLSDRSLTTWNSMINCLALHGHSESAIVSFHEMKLQGVKPDEVTFVGLLNACTHGGFIDEGLSYFESMSRDYQIEPEIEHYGCVIDLLGRAGRFEDAMKIVKNMRIEPDEVVWGSLLNGCRIYRVTELAEFAVRKLLEIDPNNTDYGVMLANLYSECGMWEEMGKVRKVMKKMGGKKLPGCSWIEVDNKTHQFYSGNKLHPVSDEIYKVLEELAGQWKHEQIS